MPLTIALNTILGSALIIILVFADYVRKYNTDHTQKDIFCSLLIFTLIPMMGDIAYYLLEGRPGKNACLALYGLTTVYYFFQVLAYYYIIIFVDHMIFKDVERVKKLKLIVCLITVIHALILLLNLKYHFYFYIDEASNIFYHGDKYYIRLIISYCPILFALFEIFISRRGFKTSYLSTIFLLVGLSFLGSSIDIINTTVKLVWPCMTAALLYSYFFILQADTKIDSLTGIGNRYSFSEFTSRLSQSSNGESWAIVMIDMDHFKHINDTLGHQEGDNALRDMAAIIKDCLRASDFAARYGGDEFVLATRVENGIDTLMQHIQDAIDRQNGKNIRPFKIEISYGYDVFTADGSRTIDNFLTHIDSLMYRHKEMRRRAGDKEAGGKV
jgi:diguanylate cyclase (GGDEF)-like protein